jgi:hypothetical protein
MQMKLAPNCAIFSETNIKRMTTATLSAFLFQLLIQHRGVSDNNCVRITKRQVLAGFADSDLN